MLSILPKWRAKQQWLFSVKVFGAAMLSLYIALALGLDHPYWAMATVYLVSNPLDGATRSKSDYRIGGTVLGAAAALVLVPPLVNEPLALMAAISFWTAALLYLSQMERGPRSYTFLLAAFTLPIVALPTVTDPTTVFDVALVRVEETVIGIVCASVVATRLCVPIPTCASPPPTFGARSRTSRRCRRSTWFRATSRLELAASSIRARLF
jgi:uncharacterized membrane protein YccC